MLVTPLEWRNQALEPPQVDAISIAAAVVAPRSRGRLSLRSVDPLAAPRIDLGLLKNVVLQHHENVDGTGYPKKLASPEIDPYAKITAIADFFDAVTTKRSYHEALNVEDALALMKKSVGKKLDPSFFDVFVEETKQFNRNKVSLLELPVDFDPCQPPEPGRFSKQEKPTIPWNKNEKPDDFGKIIIKPTRRKSAA